MRIRRWLEQASTFQFACYTTIAAFCVYFCMYAFRKPFAAAEYADMSLWGMNYKIILVISQVAGYTLSKFIGIRVIAEMSRGRRVVTLISLIVASFYGGDVQSDASLSQWTSDSSVIVLAPPGARWQRPARDLNHD